MSTQVSFDKDAVLTEVDQEAVRQTALDYMQGWYDGDATRMERSLHADLAKRTLAIEPETGEDVLMPMTKTELVGYTAEGGGQATPREKLVYEVTLLDGYQRIATVKVVGYDLVDYLHLVRTQAGWKIVNALWSLRR